MGSITPFRTDKAVVDFAKRFMRHHRRGFRQSIRICLTKNLAEKHAYFPALISCIGFLEFLGGLNSGRLRGNAHSRIVSYALEFMDTEHYSSANLEILYKCFRHKVAHLSHPYYVFDTEKEGIEGPRKLITWTVCASDRKPAIELKSCGNKKLRKMSPPWEVQYDHRVHIWVRRLMQDLINSTKGPTGYLCALEADRTKREHFAKCMKEFFPPAPPPLSGTRMPTSSRPVAPVGC